MQIYIVDLHTCLNQMSEREIWTHFWLLTTAWVKFKIETPPHPCMDSGVHVMILFFSDNKVVKQTESLPVVRDQKAVRLLCCLKKKKKTIWCKLSSHWWIKILWKLPLNKNVQYIQKWTFKDFNKVNFVNLPVLIYQWQQMYSALMMPRKCVGIWVRPPALNWTKTSSAATSRVKW